MKTWDRPARTMRCISIAGNHKRRTAVALNDARRTDSDYTSVPTFAIDHRAKGIAQACILGYPLLNCLHNTALFFLTVGVELIQAQSNITCLFRILGAE